MLVGPGVQGVVKALFDQGLLPRVLAGSSVGSIGAPAPSVLTVGPARSPHL